MTTRTVGIPTVFKNFQQLSMKHFNGQKLYSKLCLLYKGRSVIITNAPLGISLQMSCSN